MMILLVPLLVVAALALVIMVVSFTFFSPGLAIFITVIIAVVAGVIIHTMASRPFH